MYLVLIETSGNQHYIFATNKLRENVGASELTYQIGTKYVLDAVQKKTGQRIYNENTDQIWKNLLDKDKNPEIGATNNVEVVIATSGKAILLVDEKPTAEEIVREVTQKALKDMPGLTVHGSISKEFDDLNEFKEKDGKTLYKIHEAIGEIHRKHEMIRHQMPSNKQRFLRLPFVAPCATSGLPAQDFGEEGENRIPLSNLSIKKRNAYDISQKRLQKVVEWYRKEESVRTEIFLLRNVDNLEKLYDLEWLAVIHADGNGLGQIFLNFNRYAGLDEDNKWSGRLYLDAYRKFSIALDICTIKATGFALKNLQSSYEKDKPKTKSIEVPVVPIVLGGDDLTVLCDGQYAIKFTFDFLTAFEAEAQISHSLVEDIIPKITNKAFNKQYLGICAGVAIIKPHYPFHQAYELAEQLLKSAKKVKEKIKHQIQRNEKNVEEQLPCSGLDFHILYDSAHSELDEIHRKLTIDEGQTYLFAKPYIVSQIDEKEIWFKDDSDGNKVKGAREWLEHRKFEKLSMRVCAMRETEEGENKKLLPRSKMHEIRENLFRGRDVAEAETILMKNRLSKSVKNHRGENAHQIFEEKVLIRKETGKESEEKSCNLFFEESGKNCTHFLDAIEAVEFWKGFDLENA